jgi:hypothetical protein
MNISLLFETERCLDGLHLVDGFFRPRSERREPIHVVTADLEDPVVLQFMNARDDLLPFMSRYSAGGVMTPLQPAEEWHTHINTIAHWQGLLRQKIVIAGSPDQVDALVSLSQPQIRLLASFHLRDGKPQMLAQCDHLLDFMRMEIGMIALNGAKLVTCEHCKNLFLTGPSTSRRVHATHCSDRCRVAAMRARKKESQ